MVLLANRNTKEKVYEELHLFMGPELTEHFVIWVFGEVERLASIVVQPEVAISAVAAVNQPAVQHVQPVQIQSQQSQPTHPQQSQPIIGNDVQMSGNNNLKTNRSFSRALETAVNSKPAKPSPPATTTASRKSFSEEKSLKQPARRSTRLQASSQPQRTVSRGDSRAVSTDEGGKVQKIRLSVDFERDERRQARKRFNESAPGAATSKPGSHNEGNEAPVIKVKCQYWPTCKLGAACPNIHPSETCKHFPNCTKGDACTFLHPAIPCRFQERCSNPNCNYQHRAPLAMAAATAIPMPTAPTAVSGLQPSTIQCRFYPRCVNPVCPYLHPVKVPCRFGAACTRPDCHFEHPEGRKNVQLKSVVYAPCRYGRQCARVDCPFQHETTSDAAMQLEPSNTNTTDTTNSITTTTSTTNQ